MYIIIKACLNEYELKLPNFVIIDLDVVNFCKYDCLFVFQNVGYI